MDNVFVRTCQVCFGKQDGCFKCSDGKEYLDVDADWGWWTIKSELEKQSEKYDVDHLLKPPPPKDNIAFDIQDIHNSSNEQLGDILSYCGSYTSFLNSELAMLEGELGAVTSSLHIGISKVVAELEAIAPKKRLKDSMEGEAVAGSELFRLGKHRQIELQAHVSVALRYRDAWDILWQTASREITRRNNEADRRLPGR